MKSRRTKAILAVLLFMTVAILAGDYVLSRAGTLQTGRDNPGAAATDVSTAKLSPKQATSIPPTHSALMHSSSTPIAPLHNALKAIRHAEEVVMNNIVNASTFGFKLSRTRFADLSYKYQTLPGAMDEQGKLAPIGLHVGSGTRIAGTQVDHRMGPLIETGKSLHLAIVGDGFFQIQNGSEIVYTRCGNFTMNADGEIVLASAQGARLIEPAITVPQDATDVVVMGDGGVSVLQAGSQNQTQLGQIQTARFVNPQGLIQIGNNLLQLSDASGLPQIGSPGTDGRGELRSGFLESSNVNLETELIELERLQSHRRAISQAINILHQSDR